jgi:hypothetical protein
MLKLAIFIGHLRALLVNQLIRVRSCDAGEVQRQSGGAGGREDRNHSEPEREQRHAGPSNSTRAAGSMLDNTGASKAMTEIRRGRASAIWPARRS